MPIAGEMVTETFSYDDGRQVTVYVPPDPPEAIVFAGDGQLIAQWGETLEAADLPPTMIIGAPRGRRDAAATRVFAQVRSGTVCRPRTVFRRGCRCVGAVSVRYNAAARPHGGLWCFGGGELALALGLRHPDRYGAIFAASPGAGYQPPAVMPSPLPRTYLVAGTQEPFFLENATRWADALHATDAAVVLRRRVAGHDDTMWREEFPLMVEWAFGNK
ncbi:MAG: hypothetical protein R2932_51310 [Caldilineaceae bacterium]